MSDTASRRPLNSRDTRWAKAAARRLAASQITPNQISMASVGFAALGLFFFWIGARYPGAMPVMLVLAALSVQARLLCNLFDGMVAIEGGKHSPTGPYWNEAPDRAADLLFLWGAGLAAGHPALGLGAGALAIATAYLRELGRAERLAADFSGPMAKPHRMAALTLGCLLAVFLPVAMTAAEIIEATLWVIVAGTLITIARRSRRLMQGLYIRD